MNIWGWVEGRYNSLVEDGHGELAKLIYDISHYACDDRPDLVDQIFNQALPLCRSLEDHWLEIYFRHWRLQSHVLKSYRAKDLLSEAVSLLEFSHREETKECPQRICTVQDLAACYGIKDGPGYAEERIAVCKETIEEIDGAWPCYSCINGELLDALMDAERYGELQDQLDRIDTELAKHKEADTSEMVITRGRLLLRTGKIEAAKNLIENAQNIGGGSGFIRSKKLLLALIYCAEERWGEAKQLVADFSERSLDCKYLDDWTHVQLILANAGKIPNDRSLRERIHYAAQVLEQNGALRVSFRVLGRMIELGVHAKDTYRSTFALEDMRKLQNQFNRDMGAKDRILELEQLVAGVIAPSEIKSFDDAQQLLNFEFENEMFEFLCLQAGLEKWPDNMYVLRRKCALLDRCFQREKSYTLLADAHSKASDNPLLEHEFGNAFLRKHGFDAYFKEFPFSDLQGLSKSQIWNRGYIYFNHYKSTNSDEAFKILKKIENYWPDDPSLLSDLATELIRSNEFSQALAYRLKQRDADPDNTNVNWDVCIAASLAKNTEALIEASEKLDLKVTPDGLLEIEQFPRIRLQYVSKINGQDILHATRIGPVLARVDSVSRINTERQVFGQTIVFDPAPLNQLTETDKDGYACDKEGYYTYLYPSIHILDDPKLLTFAIDGIDPGEEAIDRLRKRIEDSGYVFNRRSGEQYRLQFIEAGVAQDKPGFYAYVLTDPDAALRQLSDLLEEFSRTLDHPLVWTQLCTAIDDAELLKSQRVICEKYGITDE